MSKDYAFGIEKNIFSEDAVDFEEIAYKKNLTILEALDEIKKFVKKNPECSFDEAAGERVVQVSTEDQALTAWIQYM